MPMRIGVSPRAWMMKGAATCRAPTAAAPLRTVRRSKRLEKVDFIMRSSPVDYGSQDRISVSREHCWADLGRTAGLHKGQQSLPRDIPEAEQAAKRRGGGAIP